MTPEQEKWNNRVISGSLLLCPLLLVALFFSIFITKFMNVEVVGVLWLIILAGMMIFFVVGLTKAGPETEYG